MWSLWSLQYEVIFTCMNFQAILGIMGRKQSIWPNILLEKEKDIVACIDSDEVYCSTIGLWSN